MGVVRGGNAGPDVEELADAVLGRQQVDGPSPNVANIYLYWGKIFPTSREWRIWTVESIICCVVGRSSGTS